MHKIQNEQLALIRMEPLDKQRLIYLDAVGSDA